MDNVIFVLESKGGGLGGPLSKYVTNYLLKISGKGVQYINGGLFSAIVKEDIFLPYDQIASVEISKYLMGFQVDLVITSTSGRKLKLLNTHKDQAEKAQSLIYETKRIFLNQSSGDLSESFIPKKDIQSPVDVADEIMKLSKLRDSGILSEEEFVSQKKKILNL